MNNKFMKYSIIIPVVKVNDYLRENVKKIVSLSYLDWELIIVTDSCELNEWGDKRIKQLVSGKVGPAEKRDLGATKANGEVLVFLDDDSYPSPNLLDIANKYFDNIDCIGIGGPGITPKTDTIKQRASGSIFETKILSGCTERYISNGESRLIDDWPSVNFMVRKTAFDAVNGFNTNYWPGEDTILCQKLIKYYPNGLLYAPELIVWHHRRESVGKHALQVYSYGLHRGYFVRKGIVNSIKLMYFIPSILVIIIVISATSILMNFGGGFQFTVFILYVPILFLGFINICYRHGIKVGYAAIPLILVTHLCYGLGFIRGIIKTNLVSTLR